MANDLSFNSPSEPEEQRVEDPKSNNIWPKSEIVLQDETILGSETVGISVPRNSSESDNSAETDAENSADCDETNRNSTDDRPRRPIAGPTWWKDYWT